MSNESERQNRVSSKEKIAVFTFGVFFLIALFVTAVWGKGLDDRSFFILRVTLALAGAGVASFIPGFLEVQVSTIVRASGAIAVFVVIFFFNPPPTEGPKKKIHKGFFGELYTYMQNVPWEEFKLSIDSENREIMYDLYISPEISGKTWGELFGKICESYPCLECDPPPGKIDKKVHISLKSGKLKIREGVSKETRRKPLTCY